MTNRLAGLRATGRQGDSYRFDVEVGGQEGDGGCKDSFVSVVR